MYRDKTITPNLNVISGNFCSFQNFKELYIFRFKSSRGGSRSSAATSKMERFVIIVNGFQLLTIVTKRSIFSIASALDQPLYGMHYMVCVVLPPFSRFDE